MIRRPRSTRSRRARSSRWADSGPEARHAIATAVFARTDVLGFERMEYELFGNVYVADPHLPQA